MRLFRVDFKDKIRPPILIRGKTKAQVALDMKEKYGEYIVRVDYISHEDAESQFGHFDLFKEGINVKKADMGDVVDDFYKSDAPQFKGKSKTKRRQMAIAAKLSADEDKKVPSMASLENKPKMKIQLKKATNAYDKNKDVLAKHGFKRPSMNENDKYIESSYDEEVKMIKDQFKNHIDEISKSTAASYISKASRDVYHKGQRQGAANAIAGAGGSHPDQNYDTGPERKAAKRVGGIDKATKRLMKKETFAPPYAEFITPESDLNEEMYFKVNISGLPDMYMTASSAGMIKAKLRKMLKNMDMIGDIVKTPKADVRKAFRMKAMEGEESTNEEAIIEKQRLDPKCWDGYKKQGTKMKGGIRVNNCVPEGKAYGPTGVSYYVPKGHKDEVDPKTKEKYPERQKKDTVKEKLVGDQHKLDHNKDKKIDKQDMKMVRKIGAVKEDIVDNASRFGPPKEAEVQESKKKVDVTQQVNITSILTGDNPFYRVLPEGHDEIQDKNADGLDDNQKPEGNKTAKQFPAPKDAKKKMKNMKMEFFKQDEVSDYMIEKSKLKKGDMKMRGGKLEPKAMAALKTMSQDEAKVLVQGLPANLRRSTMKELGIKEVVDGRTTAFKTTVERLITAKNKPELDEADMTDAQIQSAKKDDSAMVKSAQKKARADVINSMSINQYQ